MIRDEDLLLYHYAEGLEPAERARIATALQNDASLSQRLRQMLADLESVSSQSRVTAPLPTRARWVAGLNAAAAADSGLKPKSAPWRGWNWGAAIAVGFAMALGVGIGMRLNVPARVEDAAIADRGMPSATDPSLQRGLRLHFAATEKMLVDVASADAPTRARLLGDVIEQNRLFALAAERAHEDRLARVLRAFDSLLLEMKDETLDTQSLQLQGERLEFELIVMQTKLAQTSSKPTLQL